MKQRSQILDLARQQAKNKPKRSRRHEHDNALVVLTGAARSTCVPTPDKCDRAHVLTNPGGMLYRGDRVQTAIPRHYHPSQITSRGMPFDSMYDEWARLVSKYADAGINLGGGAVRFVGASLEERAALASHLGGADAMRAVLHQRTHCEMSPHELALEEQASAILKARRARK
jgi:hypothetical protein